MKPALFTTLAALALATISTPAEARSRHSRSGDRGIVEVQNRAGVTLTVSVEGGGTQTLSPGEIERFSAPEGRVDVRASYGMYGTSFSLFAKEVRVYDHRVTRVDATAPRSAKVRLVNDSGVDAEFFADGREIAELNNGTSRIVNLPVGAVELTAYARGQRLEAESVFLRPFDETVLVAEAPRFGDLVVDNPLPITVEVTVGHADQRIAAGGRAVFRHVPVGIVEVSTERIGGQLVDRERVSVHPFSGARVVIDAPDTGLVQLQSRDDDLIRVFADGRVLATLAPRQALTLLLPLGEVLLEMRTLDGRLVERSFVRVAPYTAAELDFGRVERDRGQHAPDEHQGCDGDHGDHDDHERDERRHQPATY
ncbi:MAG: hypothetical protein EXR71_10785 [Myxococcales bacterium]|nr:hypothetical protein [Myxococcales bacterium]